MKFRSGLTRAMQFIVILLSVPLIMGQNGCPISQDLVQTLNNLVAEKFTPAPGRQEVYISQLSFINEQTMSIMSQTEESALINEAVVEGIQRATQANPNLKFNEQGHSLKNTNANVNRFIELTRSSGKTASETHDAIVNELMGPNGIDAIVTGSYSDRAKKGTVELMPAVVTRQSKTVISKRLEFSKPEYICEDPNNQKKKALCANAHEDIAKTVKELLESI